MKEERENKDPYLKFKEVAAEEAKLEELKAARREANEKLEFDLSTQLTKDISAQERRVKKVIKKAKKAHGKGLTEIAGWGAEADKGGDKEGADEKEEKKEEKKEKKKEEKKEEKKKDEKKEE